MATKEKFELEFLLKTSPKVLNTMLTTPSGLAEWFAEDVNVKDDIFTFIWDGAEEKARLLTYRPNLKAKWIWLEDEEDGEDTYFEFHFEVDPMTKVVILKVYDFAETAEIEETTALWEQQINELKRVIGA